MAARRAMAGTICLEAGRPTAASGGATGVLCYGFDQRNRNCQCCFIVTEVGILASRSCLGLCLGSHPLGLCHWGLGGTASQEPMEGSLRGMQTACRRQVANLGIHMQLHIGYPVKNIMHINMCICKVPMYLLFAALGGA